MWQSITQALQAVIGKGLTHPQRVWVVSRHDDLFQQDIGMVNEAEGCQHHWERRRYTQPMIARIEQLPVGGLLELELGGCRETVMRVK